MTPAVEALPPAVVATVGLTQGPTRPEIVTTGEDRPSVPPVGSRVEGPRKDRWCESDISPTGVHPPLTTDLWIVSGPGREPRSVWQHGSRVDEDVGRRTSEELPTPHPPDGSPSTRRPLVRQRLAQTPDSSGEVHVRCGGPSPAPHPAAVLRHLEALTGSGKGRRPPTVPCR